MGLFTATKQRPRQMENWQKIARMEQDQELSAKWVLIIIAIIIIAILLSKA